MHVLRSVQSSRYVHVPRSVLRDIYALAIAFAGTMYHLALHIP